MKEVSESDFNVIKSYFQIQLLLEDLDGLHYDSTKDLKHMTSNYLNKLKVHAEPILNGMYKSNPKLYEDVIGDMRSYNEDVMKHYFKVV